MTKGKQGFASLSIERRRELAALGGKKSRRGPNRTIGDTMALRATASNAAPKQKP